MTEKSDQIKQPPSLADVAALANVAKSTVSRVLLGEKTLTIRPETRQRVLDAVQALGYKPNARARNLRTQRSFSLGLVIPEIDNPAYNTIIKGAQHAALLRDYSLLIVFADKQYPHMDLYHRLVHQSQVDGLLVTTVQNPALTADLHALGIPYILVNRELGVGEHTVIVDYQAGTRQAVEALVALGHSRIAYVSGPLEFYTGRTRLAGFIDGNTQNGIPFDMSRVSECDYSRKGAEIAMLRQLEHPDGRPTAVCAANIVIASGILAAAQRSHLAVPQDLSVIALLDAPVAEMLTPTVTAVQYPFFDLGFAAANDLIDAIEGISELGKARVLPPTGIVTRGSTAITLA